MKRKFSWYRIGNQIGAAVLVPLVLAYAFAVSVLMLAAVPFVLAWRKMGSGR